MASEEADAVDQMMEELQDVWGRVYVAYYGPDYIDGKECKVRNVTDEGLPVGAERKAAFGSTFTEALRTAHDQYVNAERDPHD